jgi:hypothetical protein
MRVTLTFVPSETGSLVARSFRSPSVLMTVYIAVFICGGPWLGSGSTAHRNIPQIVIAVLLAVLAARGSRPARVLMIIYSVLGAFPVFYGSTLWGPSEPLAASFLVLTSALVEVALLVSTPMYQRTRPWSQGQIQAGAFLPWPRPWVALSGVAGGLVMALVPFSDGLRETVCSTIGAGSAQSCQAFGFGYPVAYRFAYNHLAPRGIVIGAFATDWALWSVSILLVLYLIQVSRSRKASDPGMRLTAQPAPARP